MTLTNILPSLRADITWVEEGVWFGFQWPECSFQHLLTKSATTKNSLVLYEVTRKRLHPLPIAISCLLRTEVRAKHGDAAKQHLYILHFSCFSRFAHFSCPSLQAWWVYSAARCINIEHFHEHCAKHVSSTKHGASTAAQNMESAAKQFFSLFLSWTYPDVQAPPLGGSANQLFIAAFSALRNLSPP